MEIMQLLVFHGFSQELNPVVLTLSLSLQLYIIIIFCIIIYFSIFCFWINYELLNKISELNHSFDRFLLKQTVKSWGFFYWLYFYAINTYSFQKTLYVWLLLRILYTELRYEIFFRHAMHIIHIAANENVILINLSGFRSIMVLKFCEILLLCICNIDCKHFWKFPGVPTCLSRLFVFLISFCAQKVRLYHRNNI